MDFLDVFALVVLAVLLIAVIVVIAILGMLPGRIARGRKHRQADAISVGGWLGLVFPVIWPLVMIWAYTSDADGGDSRDLLAGQRQGDGK
jgi:hypothetical protein